MKDTFQQQESPWVQVVEGLEAWQNSKKGRKFLQDNYY